MKQKPPFTKNLLLVYAVPIAFFMLGMVQLAHGQLSGTWNVTNQGSDYYLYASYDLTGGCFCRNSYSATFSFSGGSHTYSGKSKSDQRIAVGIDATRTYSFRATATGRNKDIFGNCDVINFVCTRTASGNSTLTRSTSSLHPVRSLSVDTRGNDFITLKWEVRTDVPKGSHGYRIYRDGLEDENLVATVGGNDKGKTITWTDIQVGPQESHTYYVHTYSGSHSSSIRSIQGSTLEGGLIAWDGESLARTLLEWPDLSTYSEAIQVWRGNELLEELNKEATAFSDNSGLPGFVYAYSIRVKKVGSDEFRSFSSLSDSGYKQPNGKISGEVLAPFGGPVEGVIVCAERLDEVPQGERQILYCDTTDATGYYEIPDIYYYESARFRIVPRKDDHGFSPNALERTLDINGPTLGNINFTDTTSFTLTGTVTQELNGQLCGLAGVEIWVNEQFLGVVTDGSGNYALTVEEIGEYTIQPQFEGHAMEPGSQTLFVEADQSGVDFLNTEQNLLRGYVKATCDIYIGQSKLRIWGDDGQGTCLDTTVLTQEGSGYFEVDLPARTYQIEVVDFTPEGGSVVREEVLAYFAVDTLDLTQDGLTKNYIYRTAPTIRINGLPEKGCSPYEVPIVEQNIPYSLEIEVLEVFGDESCLADTGYVVIFDAVSQDNPKGDTLPIQGGFAFYEMLPGEPNILAPYQKSFEVVAVLEEETSVEQQPILITGNRPREKTFLSASPEIPFMILRDPPGDASYSYLEEASTTQTALRIFSQLEGSTKIWANNKSGIAFDSGAGFITTGTEVWGSIGGSLEVGSRLSGEGEFALSITNEERFTTSESDKITGTEGDVFVGAAMNLIYALTDVIAYNSATCQVEPSVSVIVGNEGFNTNFIYTENHISEVLIPQLRQLKEIYEETNPDSAKIYENQISVWQQTLSLNEELKEKANFVENRSFSAGAPYESSSTVIQETFGTLEFAFFMEQGVALEAGYEIAGSGISGGVETRMRMEIGASVKVGSLEKRKTGYVLNDDDPGDFFSVDILSDNAYGSPVFELVSGRSSCPSEPRAQPREGVQLLMDSYVKANVPADGSADFRLNLGNVSQSDETFTYELVFLQESNPEGAVITLGGSQIQGGIPTPYTIESGNSVNATVTVSRGPQSFAYEDLQFVLRSGCDDEAIADTVSFSVFFDSPCSGVTLVVPEEDWRVNSRSNSQLPIQLNNYDKQGLTQIYLEYAPSVGNSWTTIEAFGLGDLKEGNNGTFYTWQIPDIPDGSYKIRAKVDCEQGISYSEKKSGIIDRTAPQVFGLPEPADGLFEEGDIISISFDEGVDCLTLNKNLIGLRHLGDSSAIAVEIGCSENRLIFSAMSSTDLSGEELEVYLAPGSLGDAFGNAIEEALSWTFTVASETSLEAPLEADSDGDNIPNIQDNCSLAVNPDQSDLDGDGVGDACDEDIDGDGVLNTIDNCPYLANTNQADSNGDGIGDVCEEEADGDGDGISNSEDICPYTYNPDQVDSDQDGIGDVCDGDQDGDGVINSLDNCASISNPDQGPNSCEDSIATSREESIDLSSRIQLIPHPMAGTGTIRLSIPQQLSTQLDLYDMNARHIRQILSQTTLLGEHDIPFRTDELPNGMYFLRFQQEGQSQMFKVWVSN